LLDGFPNLDFKYAEILLTTLLACDGCLRWLLAMVACDVNGNVAEVLPTPLQGGGCGRCRRRRAGQGAAGGRRQAGRRPGHRQGGGEGRFHGPRQD